tara:strand:+ start:682 stop:1701 length:1020 start_codon:yes stop_codon:yes gene_type:complete
MKNQINFKQVSQAESNELKKIITNYGIKEALNNNSCFDEKLINLNFLNNIKTKATSGEQQFTQSKNNENPQWVVGLKESGIDFLLIIWLSENYFYNMETGNISKINSFLINTSEYDKTIVKGTLCSKSREAAKRSEINQDPTELCYFVVEQALIFKSKSLINMSYHDRYSPLFQLKYNKSQDHGICLVINTLYDVKYIQHLMKEIEVPFLTLGLKFINPSALNVEANRASDLPIFIWKRSHEITVNFKIKANENSTEFLLLNCKKPTQTIHSNNKTSTNKNIMYNEKIVKCVYYDNQWIPVEAIDTQTVNSQTQFKNIMSFIKENITLENIYEATQPIS